MLKIVCITLLAVAAQLQGTNAFYSDDSSSKLRMIGGDVVNDATSYSFQAAIRPAMTQNGFVVNLNVCSGVLIKGLALDTAGTTYEDAYFILTSAACVLSGNTYDVWVGTNEVKITVAPDAAAIPRADAIIHPEFLTSGMAASDLAIIRAPAAIKTLIDTPTAVKRPTAALLPSIDTAGNSFLASSVNMAGWGYPNDVFSAASPKLRQLNARVVPNFYCSLRHLGMPITNKHICTGGLINKGPCTGDSGAPLIAQNGNNGNRVIGLATMVPGSGCSKGKPGVFTRLGSYLQWIVSVTNYDAEQ